MRSGLFHNLVARMVIAVMLSTFLSPSFAWHMHADHQELVATVDAHSHHDEDRHDDAHGSIGHLLGHLAMQVAPYAVQVLGDARAAPRAELAPQPIAFEFEPPDRPPLSA